MSIRPGQPVRLSASAVVGAVALAGYLMLAPHVSGDGDGSEFTLVLATRGIAHPTGYPLYTMAGSAFCHALHALGVGWPYAANAWSALGAAVAMFFLHAFGRRLARRAAPEAPAWRRELAALLPVALLALNPIWSSEAMLAEVNSWHIAWVCATASCFGALLERISAAGDGGGAALRRGAAVWGLLAGLGLAHHLTSALVSGPLSIGLLVALGLERKLRPAPLLVALGAALVPLAGYAYIGWGAFHGGGVRWDALEPSLRSVLGHITGERYRHFLGYFAPSEEHREQLVRAGYPLLFPGLALLFVAAPRALTLATRILWGSLFVAALAVTLHAFHYGVLDPGPYFLPAIVLGLMALAPLAAELLAASSRPVALALAVIVPVAIGALMAPWCRDTLERRQYVVNFERIVRAMWSTVPADSAIVFWPDDRYMRLIEYQVLRHEKPALTVLDPEVLADDAPRARFIARFGVDPLEGLVVPRIAPGSPGEAAAIRGVLRQMIRRINARTPVPVILFDLTKPEVRLLSKPPG